MISQHIVDQLPRAQRLALAYGNAGARPVVLALLAFDAQLAGIVRRASEPVLGQLRLAWWRDLLQKPLDSRPAGQPLAAALATWQGEERALGDLVDAWEGLLAEPPLGSAPLERLAEARAQGWAAAARLTGHAGEASEAERAGRNWALVDLASHLSRADEHEAVRTLAGAQDWRRPVLGRALRPLTVLHGLARRAARRGAGGLLERPGDFSAAIRLGMIGR